MTKRVFGINIAVHSLEEAIPKYKALLGGIDPESVGSEMSAFQGQTAVSFNFDGFRINLLTSSTPGNPVEKFLKNKGEGVLLVSVESDAIEKDIADLGAKGINCMMPQSSEGRWGKVNFIHPKVMNGVQFELYEPAAWD